MRRPSIRFLAALACIAAGGASAKAQGSDDCAGATTIAGTGVFTFDNSAATQGTEAQGNALCNHFGSTSVDHDVWFEWMAPATGTFTLSTCGGTSVDTKIAVFNAGICPTATPLACAEDSCSLQSQVSFGGLAGNVYAIQLGTYPSASGGAGTFSIEAGGITCGTVTTPDLIIGDIHSIANYAPAAGLDAISLGTFACNVGGAPIQWSAGTSQHPVIGGSLYRYRVMFGSGRFEEIGMSWLKHGFAASVNSLCCTCTPPSTGSFLGVGCADPYDANVNGTQSGLGPRWQVNAKTGTFAYPPANPTWGGPTARRLEFAASDIDLHPGVRYFGEAQCVAADDATANNQSNNASYRELSVSGGPANFELALAGTTQRAEPAIRAWAEIDPGVTLTEAHAAGDGSFFVASRATPLGGGGWHYEYAVYNQSSERNGGAFTLLVPVGAIVRNIDFHDVAYRNGDGPLDADVSGADWTAGVSTSSITWTCEAMSVNPGANAIRWSSTYNFRFDVDAPPMNGTARVGLWKPGTPAFVDVAAQVPAGGVQTSFPYCFGDGLGTQCPCFNSSNPGENSGCANTLGIGANLTASGTARIQVDTLVLAASNLPGSTSCLFFQGTTQTNGGLGVAFGNGLRCASGTIIRLATKSATNGAAQYPAAGETPIHVRGLVAAGDVRDYQVWYRNADVFCTTDAYNVTNGWQETWSQ